MSAATAVGHAPTSVLRELPTGALCLELEEGASALASLLDFAARANPKRAFLFLSKVLGKHYPVDSDRDGVCAPGAGRNGTAG